MSRPLELKHLPDSLSSSLSLTMDRENTEFGAALEFRQEGQRGWSGFGPILPVRKLQQCHSVIGEMDLGRSIYSSTCA